MELLHIVLVPLIMEKKCLISLIHGFRKLELSNGESFWKSDFENDIKNGVGERKIIELGICRYGINS